MCSIISKIYIYSYAFFLTPTFFYIKFKNTPQPQSTSGLLIYTNLPIAKKGRAISGWLSINLILWWTDYAYLSTSNSYDISSSFSILISFFYYFNSFNLYLISGNCFSFWNWWKLLLIMYSGSVSSILMEFSSIL